LRADEQACAVLGADGVVRLARPDRRGSARRRRRQGRGTRAVAHEGNALGSQLSSSSSPVSGSLTLGSFLISSREIFQARWTTQESDRSRRAASSLISWSIDSGK